MEITNVFSIVDPMKSPIIQRAREQFRSISIDNQMEPNDFFGGGINDSSLLDGVHDGEYDESRSRHYSFAESNHPYH